jgi:hypothetical protein
VLALAGRVQAIDGQAEIRQYVVIDDIFEEDGVGVESIPVEDDAIVECLVLTNGELPAFKPAPTLGFTGQECCDAFRRKAIRIMGLC